MITYDKLKEKPQVFKCITGVTINEFDDLYQKFCPMWARAEKFTIELSRSSTCSWSRKPLLTGIAADAYNEFGLATSFLEWGSIVFLFLAVTKELSVAIVTQFIDIYAMGVRPG